MRVFLLIKLLGATILIISSHAIGLAQINIGSQKTLHIYIDIGKLDTSFSRYMNDNHFKSLRRLTMSMIDRNRDGVAELDVVKKYVEKYYPHIEDSGLCVIDWEGIAIKRLKAFAKNGNKYRNQIDEYIKVVETIKGMRSNVKVGVYGVPFRMWANNELMNNPYRYEYLFPLLEKCDFISPSVYNLYDDSEVPNDKNQRYFITNITTALELGSNLAKPVLPYVGIRYYTKKSKYSWQLVPIEKFKRDIKNIINTTFEEKHVEGIILWNGDLSSNQNVAKASNTKDFEQVEFLKSHFLNIKQYTSIIDSLGNK